MEDVNAIRPTPIDDEKTDKEPEVDKEAETYLSEKPNYPTLPEEPKGDRSLLCRVRVRLPDGRTCQRNFLRSDPIQVNIFFLSSSLPSILLVPIFCWHSWCLFAVALVFLLLPTG